MIARPSFIVALTLLLPACSTGGGYPSLAKRPFERAAQASPVPPAAEPLPATNGDLLSRVETFRSQGQDGTAAFDVFYEIAAERVRAGASAPVGSESWVVAEVAVARLEQERAPLMVALAGLDSPYAERMNAAANGDAAPSTLEAIEAVRQPMLAAVESQNDRLEKLKAMLSEP